MELTHSDYGNFYALRRFGFLYWLEDVDGRKRKGGHWWVAVSRIYEFLKGRWEVAEYAEKDTSNNSGETSLRRITINQIPRYKTLWVDNDNFLPSFIKYEDWEQYFKWVAFNNDTI